MLHAVYSSFEERIQLFAVFGGYFRKLIASRVDENIAFVSLDHCRRIGIEMNLSRLAEFSQL